MWKSTSESGYLGTAALVSAQTWTRSPRDTLDRLERAEPLSDHERPRIEGRLNFDFHTGRYRVDHVRIGRDSDNPNTPSFLHSGKNRSRLRVALAELAGVVRPTSIYATSFFYIFVNVK